MDFFSGILLWFIPIAFIVVIIVFAVVATKLFIKDGRDAKREGRSRDTSYKVMFIFSMILLGLLVIMGILICILSVLIMRSM